MTDPTHSPPDPASPVSLVGYYLIGIVATTIGAVLVLLINLFTPLEFFQGNRGRSQHLNFICGFLCGINKTCQDKLA